MSFPLSAGTILREAYLGFRSAVQSVPRMTTRLNHAKRHLVEVLDKIIEEYQAVENLSTEAEKVFLGLLEKLDSVKGDTLSDDDQEQPQNKNNGIEE